MERFVFAVFTDHDAAQGAVDALLDHGVPEDVIDLAVHEDRMQQDDLPGPAVRSRRLSVIGSGATAVAGALVGFLTGGTSGAGFGLLMGGMLGFLFASLFGRVEPKAKVEALAEEVAHGRVIVTVDVSNEPAALDLERFFEDHGAREVGMT